MSPLPSYQCPHCQAISYNPNDLANHYCGRCHQYGNERGGFTVTIDESQRQALLLALAQLSLDRPGFDYMLWELAQKWELGLPREKSMYERFRKLHEDRIRPMAGFGGSLLGGKP